MVVTCCVRSCKEKFVKGGKITFHAFPTNEERRKVWTLSLGRKDFVPSVHSKICSKHFAEECFDREKFGGHWLKPTAVPTIYDFPNHTLPKEIPRRKRKKRGIEEEGCSSLVATTTTVESGKPHSCNSESLPLEDTNLSVVSTSHSTIKRSLNCLVEATTTVELRNTRSSKRKSCPSKDTNSSAASTSHSTLKISGKKNCLVATTTTNEPEKVHSRSNESNPSLKDVKSCVASISQPSPQSSGEKYLLVATTVEPENLHFHINESNPTLKDIKSCVASTSESSSQCSGEKYLLVKTTVEPEEVHSYINESNCSLASISQPFPHSSGEKYLLVAATTTVEPINANFPNIKSHPSLEITNSSVASTSHLTLTRSEKEYRHVSDFTMEDMESPSKAKKLFQMATKNHKKNRQLENKLYARFTRLKKKVKSLQAIVDEFKKNSLISEGAVHILEL